MESTEVPQTEDVSDFFENLPPTLNDAEERVLTAVLECNAAIQEQMFSFSGVSVVRWTVPAARLLAHTSTKICVMTTAFPEPRGPALPVRLPFTRRSSMGWACRWRAASGTSTRLPA